MAPKSYKVRLSQTRSLEAQGRASVQVQMQCADRIPSGSGEISLRFLKAFSWLDKTHPYYGGQSVLLKVH